MITMIPFFVAGFFYAAWPWGFFIGGVLGAVPLVTSPERYAHVWHDRKSSYVQSAMLALVLSAAIHGASMALGNGVSWLMTSIKIMT